VIKPVQIGSNTHCTLTL